MDEHFADGGAWNKVRRLSACPLACGAVGQYFNKAAFTSLDKSNFGTSVGGSAGGDNVGGLGERDFISFRTNIRAPGGFGGGVERFDGSAHRSQNVFQAPSQASLVAMNKGHFLPNPPQNLMGRFTTDPTSFLA